MFACYINMTKLRFDTLTALQTLNLDICVITVYEGLSVENARQGDEGECRMNVCPMISAEHGGEYLTEECANSNDVEVCSQNG